MSPWPGERIDLFLKLSVLLPISNVANANEIIYKIIVTFTLFYCSNLNIKIYDCNKMETVIYTLPILPVSTIISKLFNNSFLADIHFSIENKVIYAHSFVMMCRSGYLHKIFSAYTPEVKKPSVYTVKRYNYELFYQFVKFIYTDKCTLHKFDIAISLLHLAVVYDVITLENFIIANITTRTLTTADRFKLFQLHESQRDDEYVRYTWIKDCVAPFADELFQPDTILQLTPKAIENILKWSFIGRNEKQFREIDMFNHFTKWLVAYSEANKIDLGQRRKLFDHLKTYIRFPVMAEFEFRECMKKSDGIFQCDDFCYSPKIDYSLYLNLQNQICRKPYIKSENCKWMARCYADQNEIPTYLSPIGTKLIAFQIISYYPIWSVTLRKDPPDDLNFPMSFNFKDNQFRKYISLGNSFEIYHNNKYYIQIHVVKEGRIIDGCTEDITNTNEKYFYTKRSIIHGYEIETYFKK